MCMKPPKPPKIDPSVKAAQEAAARAEQERIAELKKQQTQRTRAEQRTTGMRSLVSGSSGSGFGRNFF